MNFGLFSRNHLRGSREPFQRLVTAKSHVDTLKRSDPTFEDNLSKPWLGMYYLIAYYQKSKKESFQMKTQINQIWMVTHRNHQKLAKDHSQVV